MTEENVTMPVYRLTVTGKELQVMNTALEWFFRLQMGQYGDYADELAKDGYVYDRTDPENGEKFRAYINRRNDCIPVLELAYRIAQPQAKTTTPDMTLAMDLWQIIRHYLWEQRPEPKPHYTTDASKPCIMSKLTTLKIEREL